MSLALAIILVLVLSHPIISLLLLLLLMAVYAVVSVVDYLCKPGPPREKPPKARPQVIARTHHYLPPIYRHRDSDPDV